MPNLFALSGEKHNLDIKLVRMSNPIQNHVHDMFLGQERAFRKGCRERAFHANWKPDDRKEIMTVPIPSSGGVFAQLLKVLGTSVAPPMIEDIKTGNIKGLATIASDRGKERILVQTFEQSQILNTKYSFFLERGEKGEMGTYNRIKDSAFRIDNKLTCIVEFEEIKFKSLPQLSKIIDTSEIYHEATDKELEEFADHPLIKIHNLEVFKKATKKRARGQIHIVLKDAVLDECDAKSLRRSAKETGLNIEVQDGMIVMPVKNSEIEELSRFLNSGRYKSPVTAQIRIANSHRAVESSSSN